MNETAKFKRRMLSINLWGATAGVIALWGLFAVENVLGFSIQGHRFAPGQSPMSIWLPVVGTLIAYIGAFVCYWRSVGFLSRAVPVVGEIASVGTLEMYGMRDVIFSYEYAGRLFQNKRSISMAAVGEFEAGDNVTILVDRANPLNSRLANEFVWKEQPEDETHFGD